MLVDSVLRALVGLESLSFAVYSDVSSGDGAVSFASAFVAAVGVLPVLLGWVLKLDEAVVAARVDGLPEQRGTGLCRLEECLLAVTVRPRGIARQAYSPDDCSWRANVYRGMSLLLMVTGSSSKAR